MVLHRTLWMALLCTLNNIELIHGSIVYLDKDLFDTMEQGNVTRAAELLRRCENDVSCTIIPDKDYDHYEIWDFVRQPTPSMVRPKVSVINSITSMAPSTIIHMKSPSAQRYLTTPGYYRNAERSGHVEMKYQLSPQAWLSACVLRTNGQTTCTELIRANAKSAGGGEILELKRSEEDFQIQFRFGCRTEQCVLILRQLRLYGIKKAPTISRQTTAVLSDKAVEIINNVNEMSHYTWIDRGFQGRDLSHLIENAIQQEKDELEAMNNPPTPPPNPLPKRPKYSPTTPPPTTTAQTTTRRSTTCRPRTTTTESPSTAEPQESDENDDDSTNNDVSDNSGGGSKSKGSFSILHGIFVIQALAFLGKLLGISLAGAAVDAVTKSGEEKAAEELVGELGLLSHALPLVEELAKRLPQDGSSFVMVKPAFLAGMYLAVKIVTELRRKDDGPMYTFILNAKIHDIVVERSFSMHERKVPSVEQEAYPGPKLEFNGPEIQLDTDLQWFKDRIPNDLNYDKPDAGPSWNLFFQDNYPKLQIDQFENWFLIDKASSTRSFRHDWFLNEAPRWKSSHATVLTKKRPKSTLRSEFFRCPPDARVYFPILYQFHSFSPSLYADVCVKFIHSTMLLCSPSRNSTACTNNWCGLDFSSYFNSHPDKYTPFQIVATVKTRDSIPENTLIPAVIHVRTSMKTNTTDNCAKVQRSSMSAVNLKDECENETVPMIEAKSVSLSTEYEDNKGGYSAMTEFTFTGQWYKSTCALDFGNKLRKWNTPFTSLIPRTIALSAVVTPDDEQFVAGEELKCTSKSLTIDFVLSSTNPYLYVYICLYRASNSVTYSCSHSFQSTSNENPHYQFYSEVAADKIEISVGSRDGYSNGTLTMLFEPIKVVCA